ncbi:MAG: hypothetical protein FJ403_05855 [Verrucomicrobia bacterium]|nr:hypothetical protein [Verrucomicrobiota bacterium]
MPLGIALESYSYPYPVQNFSLDIEGERVRMAYMVILPSCQTSGRIVLLLHGKSFYGSSWKETIKALSEAGHLVVIPDQIGFGKSSKPSLHYSFDLLAQNTARLLDFFEL